MKMYQLLAVVIPSMAMAVSIDFESVGARTFANQGILLDGYLINHAGSFAGVLDSSAEPNLHGNDSQVLYSFNRSWITFSRADGIAFDALGFDGSAAWNLPSRLRANGIMVEGQTLGGEYRSQFLQFGSDRPNQFGAADLVTFNLDGAFQNLAWLRFSGLGGSPEFALDNLQLRSARDVINPTNVPDGGPGLLAVGGLLAALAWGHWRESRRRLAMVASPTA